MKFLVEIEDEGRVIWDGLDLREGIRLACQYAIDQAARENAPRVRVEKYIGPVRFYRICPVCWRENAAGILDCEFCKIKAGRIVRLGPVRHR